MNAIGMMRNTLKARTRLFAALLIALFIVWRPWQMPATGLDASWMSALEYAYLKGFVFGRDFDFTFGPLSFIHTRLFHPLTFPWIAAATIHAAAVYTALIYLGPITKVSFALVAGFAFFVAPVPDVLYLSLPMIVVLLSMTRLAPGWLVALLVVGLALSGLAKFSALTFCLPLLLLADLSALIERRKGFWHTPLYCASIVFFYGVSGQPIGSFFEFLSGSLDVASGYGETMGNFSWGLEQTILIMASLGVLTTAVVTSRHAPSIASLFGVFALGWYLFFCFKLGNVRAGHQATTWQAVATCGLLLGILPGKLSNGEQSAFERQNVLACAIWILVAIPSQIFAAGGEPLTLVNARVSAVVTFSQDLASWVNPHAKLRTLTEQRRSRDDALAQRFSDGFSGTVGSVPWEFTELIAAGAQFVPSPALQTYANYTPRLRARTTEYFASKTRPTNLFFQLASIDGRYSTLDLGPALIPVLAGYDIVLAHSRLVGAPLQLLRRAHQRSVERRVVAAGSGRMDDWVDAPVLSSGRLLLAVRPRETVAGKMLTLLYKQERLGIDLRFANGQVVSALAVPSLTADGFLILSPGETDLQLFLAASAGLGTANPLTAFRVTPPNLGALRFSTDYEFEASAVAIAGRPEHELSKPSPPSDAMQALINGRVIEAPEVRVLDGKLLAHPPSKIVAQMPTGRRLTGELGFFDGAWQNGSPRPVTFAVSIMTSNGAHVLFQRTLDPASKPEDRGPQTFSIELASGKSDNDPIELQFETYPGTSWGWTYWSRLHLGD